MPQRHVLAITVCSKLFMVGIDLCAESCSTTGSAPGQAFHKRQSAGKLLCSPIIACRGLTGWPLWSCPASLVSTTVLCSLLTGLKPLMKLQTSKLSDCSLPCMSSQPVCRKLEHQVVRAPAMNTDLVQDMHMHAHEQHVRD